MCHYVCLSEQVAKYSTVRKEADAPEIEELFELLKLGDENIVFDPKYKNPIFVLGNTGSGKSSLVQFIATDNLALYAKETFPGSGEFYIVDDNEQIGSGLNTQTNFPELVVDKQISAAIYDFPGFNNTRSSANDVATSYFTKKVFDFADEIKIVLTVNYSSVRLGIDRMDFIDLMRHATTLIKNIEKYQNSIALVATKVENSYVKEEGSYVLVSDERVVDGIANFMLQTKRDIKNRLELIQGDLKEETFLKNSLKLIDTLLVKDNAGKFTKLGIFRRPDEAGPLTEIELLQRSKPQMRKLFYETLKFTKKEFKDFGYTVSEKSKYDLAAWAEVINERVWSAIENVAIQLKHISGIEAVSKLASAIAKTTDIQGIAKALEISVNEFGLDFDVSSIERQGAYYEFLQIVNEAPLPTRDWGKIFTVILG